MTDPDLPTPTPDPAKHLNTKSVFGPPDGCLPKTPTAAPAPNPEHGQKP